MTVQLHNASLDLAFNGINAARAVEKSIIKLSTGKKHVNAREDAGGFEQAIRIENEQKLTTLAVRNLQNLISYTQMQEGALGQAANILQRMNTLSQLALDVTKTDTDRIAYNHEFVELSKELDSIKGLKLNDVNLFQGDPVYFTINDPEYSEGKAKFIDILRSQWLKGAEQTVNDRLGLQGTGQINLVIEVSEEEAYPVLISESYDGNNAKIKFFLDTYRQAGFPVSSPSDWAERYNVQAMTRLILRDNLYYDALANGNQNKGVSTEGGAHWFKDGLEEFIHGGDYLIQFSGVSNITDLVNAMGSGDDQSGGIIGRASNYLSTRYLHEELKAAGAAEGVKTMLRWMSDQVADGKTAEQSSIGAALVNFIPSKYTTISTANDEFISDYKANATTELGSKIHVYNADTGAIGGFDAENGAGAVISVADAVPNTGPGYELTDPVKNPTSGFNVLWEGEDNVLVPDDGQLFETVEMVTVDNIQSHNLKTIESSNATLNKIEELLESLSTERARVAANTKRILTQRDNFESSLNSKESALSRIADTDFAKESTTLAKNQIRTQASMAILAQGQESRLSLQKLLAGVKTKGGKPSAPPLAS
jgi:flagellin